jgi:superfamily II DNA or RNA helicase
MNIKFKMDILTTAFDNLENIENSENKKEIKSKMKAFLTRSGVFVNKTTYIKTYGINQYKILQKKLYIRTIVDRFRNVIRTCNLLEYNKQLDMLIIPRFIGFELMDQNYFTIQSQITTTNEEINIDKIIDKNKNENEYEIKLTKNQVAIMDYLNNNIYTKNNIKNGKAGCVLHLAAGQGKTYVAAALIKEFKNKFGRLPMTAIIVPKETLLNQTKRVMESIFSVDNVGLYYNKIKCINKINIFIIDSSLSNEFNYSINGVIDTSDDVDSLKPFTIIKKINENYINNIKERNMYYRINGDINILKENYNLDPENQINVWDKYIKVIKKSKNFIDFYKQFDLIIYDEVHEYCSKNTHNIFKRASAPLVLGLTATPYDRIDKFDKIATMFLGNLITASELPNYDAGEFKFTSTLHGIKFNSHDDYTIHKEFHNDTLIQLSNDPYRNKLIIDTIINLSKTSENQIYVFTERRRHATILSELYKLYLSKLSQLNNKSDNDEINNKSDDDENPDKSDNENPDKSDNENPDKSDNDEINNKSDNDEINNKSDNDEINNKSDDENSNKSDDENPDKSDDEITKKLNTNEILMGGVSASRELHAEKHANVIFATYAYLGTGKSIPKMNKIILALPRKSKMEQIIGRIFRLGGNEDIHREIIDIIDNKLSIKNQHYVRKKIIMEKYNSDVIYSPIINYNNIIFTKTLSLNKILKIVENN